MNLEEFYEQVFKPIYVQSCLKEMVSKDSAEDNFQRFCKEQTFHEIRNYLIYKIFIHNLQGTEVEKLRELESTDYVLGIEDYFD